jgi:hypothetical protein
MFLILAFGCVIGTLVLGSNISRPPYIGPTLSAEVLYKQKWLYYSSCAHDCQSGEKCLFIDSKTLVGTRCVPVTNRTKCNTRAVAQHAIEEVCKAKEECLQEAGQGGEGYCVDISIYGLEKNQGDETDITATDNSKKGNIQVVKIESSKSEDVPEKSIVEKGDPPKVVDNTPYGSKNKGNKTEEVINLYAPMPELIEAFEKHNIAVHKVDPDTMLIVLEVIYEITKNCKDKRE